MLQVAEIMLILLTVKPPLRVVVVLLVVEAVLDGDEAELLGAELLGDDVVVDDDELSVEPAIRPVIITW